MDWDDERRKARLIETRWGREWRVLGRTRRCLLRVSLASIPLLLLFGVYWRVDVAPEQRRLADTRPSIDEIYGPRDPADATTAVVDLVGLGNLDAAPTAATLPALADLGRVWSVRYDNRGLDTRVISDLIDRRATAVGVSNIVLVGHSMGGVVALEAAQHLYEDSDKTVGGVVLDCTPVDLHAVREASRDAGEDLLRWIGWLPGARESRSLRTIVEMAARQDRFVDRQSSWLPHIEWGEAASAFDEVMRDKVLNPSAASNGFIESQFKTIVASGALDNLDALSDEVDGKTAPAIVFLRPRDGAADNVVDVDYSQRILFERSGGPDGNLRVVRMPGTGHANPRQAADTYNSAITTRVVPMVDASSSRAWKSSAGPDPTERGEVSPR
ncbi:alpha/beta hydrolase [Rhodococcus sp. 14-2470-1b]|uniref:alpha/beta fold hydrolase n=1 Tax=Rhodococcus sp. 14-2470-1b TaxID=2023149 RepID=UPI000B9C2C53|nr:alpha/beta hydrolase [Rhodococcus sp. 14-2470-1b]OZF44351.1 alpha/beta hydrolase [Rhodococcus sp. 14-2470-1b]